ncbi:C40 family peptidase [Micromonospora sp. WMMD1082]|uniref:C40 family peptidase n=1 Tax=Micromonospora sp. WMMD1082 TaxID=3016104 RepID=UPI00241724F8|nr:C40 family peptidase [Micromonospora sp. WMMD1082]MDG4795274.1 NlpC/P60 family protein [Micromonospora sp. WMMD1082]
MIDSADGRRQRRRSPVVSPVLRPALWSALLAAVASAVLATPAYAEPGVPVTVPDTGSRPIVTGPLQLPGGAPADGTTGLVTPPLGTPGASALETQINAAEARVAELGTRLLELEQQRTEVEAQFLTAERDLEFARAAVQQAQQRADQVAAEAIKAAAALPPGDFATDLRDLELLRRANRGEKVEHATGPAAGELARTRSDEQVATQAYTAAQSRFQGVQEQYAATRTALRDEEAKLLKLREDNAAQLIELARQQEAAEQQLGADYVDQSAGGLVAHPTALAAVAYARKQLGDPYVWAAEGPDSFDCSGLMWAAYRSAGHYQLPRISRDQYRATSSRSVPRTALLPGDLLFFASGSSWTSIHHVGMYIGGGKMIHAPTTGDVVKISTVRWSRLYAATRVVGAIPTPTSSPTPSQPPAPKPTPTPTKTTTPRPTPSPTPSGSTSPSPTPSGSTSPSPTPSGSTSPSPTPTGSTSPSPTPSGSSSPAPEPSDSVSPTNDAGSAAPTTAAGTAGPTTAASSSHPVDDLSATPSAPGGR